MSPPEILETDRLRLRRSAENDAEAIFTENAQGLEVTKYLSWKPTGKIEDAHFRQSSMSEDIACSTLGDTVNDAGVV